MIEAPTYLDFYKTFHAKSYRSDMSGVYANFTTRHNKHTNIPNGSTCYVAGLQGFISKVLEGEWSKFFNAPTEDEAVAAYEEVVSHGLGRPEHSQELRKLYQLGYLPLKIKALPEGTEVPYGIPHFTVESTVEGFGWLTNNIETIASAEVWPVQTALTTAVAYYRTFNEYAELTGSPKEFIPFQGHDFSFRGMMGVEAAKLTGMGHLMSGFIGSDTIPAALSLKKYYSASLDPSNPCTTIASVDATEHSVQCSFEGDDLAYITHCMDKASPTGILSIVSDGYDFWALVTEVLPQLKDKIMARNGKVVIRPDSGDPVDILCGDPKGKNVSEVKGLVEVLYDMFGGTVNEKGYKVLDDHIGCIYGDSITLERQEQILQRLADKGFASCNVVLGIGSYTYQYVTRDTHGSAVKATSMTLQDGNRIAIHKDPKTGGGEKKSARGLLFVSKEDGTIYLEDNVTKEKEDSEENMLQTVWENGKFVKTQALQDIREQVKTSL